MPQKLLRFTGINRKVSEFQSAGSCEELINLRPSPTNLEVVKPKQTKINGLYYDIYNHDFGSNSFFIGVSYETSYFEILVYNESGVYQQGIDVPANGEEYSIAFLSNQILFTNNENLFVFAYKDGRYISVDSGVPTDLDVSYTVGTGYGYGMDVNLESSNPNDNVFKEEVMKQWSAAIGQNSEKSAIYGPVLVAFNISLSDGSEFWTNKWIYVNPFLYLPHGSDGKHMIYYEDADRNGRFTFTPYNIYFKISKLSKSKYDETMIRSVNVYSTRPVFPYNLDTMSVVTDGVNPREVYGKTSGMGDNGITKELLYFQKSIPIDELNSGDVSFTLDFGEAQAGERVLEVDNGTVKRAGKVVAYNNRAHFYNSYTTIYPQSIVCLSNIGDEFETRDAYVYLDCVDRMIVLKTSAQVPVSSMNNTTKKITCCYPDARAKKILIANPTTSSFTAVTLKSSPRYNFSWGEESYPSADAERPAVTSASIHEANAINVSEQFNPFVFPVEYSYSIGGEIIDLATSYLPISSTQIGQYPLTVFTNNGVFVMEQGGGSSLYGSVVPIQPLVLDGKPIATPHGTFFASSSGLYLLVGRDVVNVSAVLNGERELNIRESEAYKRLCCSDEDILFDFSPVLSIKNFEEFVKNVNLTYDQLQNEIIISSKDESIGYSYVFNINTKMFHKISRRYKQNQGGSRYAVEYYNSRANVVDLHVEDYADMQQVFLQSRPMSLEALYTHIQRLILLVDTNVSHDEHQYLFLSVFAGDNLYDWKCIISSQKCDTVLRHIRTNRAAKSYRDYIIVINGVVSTDTDISDIIADYTVVNRRLG